VPDRESGPSGNPDHSPEGIRAEGAKGQRVNARVMNSAHSP